MNCCAELLLPQNRTPNQADWEAISADWLLVLNQRIAQLEKLRDKWSRCVKCGCLSLKSCAIYNPEDTVGKESRYLNDLAVTEKKTK